MKISHFIFLGFLLILLMFSFTTYINFRLSEEVNENSEFFARSTTIVRHTNRFQRNIMNMASGLRGYLFTGENHFMQAYDSAAIENAVILQELSNLIHEGSVQRKAIDEIIGLNEKWVNEYANPLIQAKKNALISDSSLFTFNQMYRKMLTSGSEQVLNNRLQNTFRNFSNYEYNLRDVRKAVLEQSIERTRDISFYLTSFSVITGCLIAGFLAYRISTRIVKMVNMANSISSGQYEVSMEDRGKDELSMLAQSLNRMAKILSENISLLKRKNQELDQFAHIVSHDMKAPLRGIDNVITWIEEDHHDELSPKVKEYIALIKGRLIRAENLIRGILSYSRVGKEEVGIEEVNVREIIREIEDTVEKPGIKLIANSDLPVFMTERVPLMQVFANLISNAVKYHDKENGIIKIYHTETDQAYEFFVEDNGPGISRSYHNKIFVIFQTLHTRDNVESTGVGLAIVKKILDDRKQQIKVISEQGKGAIFAFTWPKSQQLWRES